MSMDLRCPSCQRLIIVGFDGYSVQGFCRACKLEFKVVMRSHAPSRLTAAGVRGIE